MWRPGHHHSYAHTYYLFYEVPFPHIHDTPFLRIEHHHRLSDINRYVHTFISLACLVYMSDRWYVLTVPCVAASLFINFDIFFVHIYYFFGDRLFSFQPSM